MSIFPELFSQSADNPSGSANVGHRTEVFTTQLKVRATLITLKNLKMLRSCLFTGPLLPCKAPPAGLINSTTCPQSGGGEGRGGGGVDHAARVSVGSDTATHSSVPPSHKRKAIQ